MAQTRTEFLREGFTRAFRAQPGRSAHQQECQCAAAGAIHQGLRIRQRRDRTRRQNRQGRHPDLGHADADQAEDAACPAQLAQAAYRLPLHRRRAWRAHRLDGDQERRHLRHRPMVSAHGGVRRSQGLGHAALSRQRVLSGIWRLRLHRDGAVGHAGGGLGRAGEPGHGADGEGTRRTRQSACERCHHRDPRCR